MATLAGPETVVLVIGAAVGSLVFGVSGFAFGLTASAIWLQAMPPAKVVPLVVGCPLVMNIVTLPGIRRDVELGRLWPFVVGSAAGIPIGLVALASVPADAMRLAVGALIVAYCVFALSRRSLPRVALSPRAGRAADGGAGLVGGIMGGMSGLSVIVPSIWIGLRGGSKEAQRGLLQAYGLFCHVVTLALVGAFVGLARETLVALAICLPIVIAGSLAGLRLFARLSSEGFRRAVLWVLLAGGMGLLARAFAGG